MDELPDLLLEAVGSGTVIDTIDIGGGDAISITTTETYLYRSDGLLSDESVETFGHDVDRLGVDTGRRKTTVLLETIDGERSFTIPAKTADSVIEGLLEGVLRTTDVLGDEETIEAQFRFSELTVVVTDRQLLKHVGSAVWDDDYEAAPYEAITRLDFEEGSVATQVIVGIDGRQQRVKVPNEHAGRVRQAVQTAVFEHHDVSSLGGLRAKVSDKQAEDGNDEVTADDTPSTADSEADTDDGFVSADWSPPADQDITSDRSNSPDDEATGGVTTADSPTDTRTVSDVSPESDVDVAELAERIETLTATVERQSELIKSQQETIDQLVDELRRGR